MKYVIKITTILIIIMFSFIESNAEDFLFGRIQVGTQSSTSLFEGTSFEVNLGTTIKGIEVGIAFNNYANRWGKNEMETIHINRYDNYDLITISENSENTRYQNFGLYASVGYDLCHL